MQIARIATSKFHTSHVVDIHVGEVGIDVIAEIIVVFRCHVVWYATLHVVIVVVAIDNGHLIHADDAEETFLLTTGFGKTEGDFGIGLTVNHTLGDAV